MIKVASTVEERLPLILCVMTVPTMVAIKTFSIEAVVL